MANGLPGHQSDALASPFLEQKLGAPILLDDGSSTVPQNTMTCLSTNKVKNVIMIGGSGSNGGTASVLTAAGYTVDSTTYAGSDRFDTARRVDSNGGAAGGGPTGILASGDDNHLVDALGAGAMSFGDKFPILLTSSSGCSLPSATQTTITNLGIKKVIVVGGTAAVPACQYSSFGSNADTSATTGADRAQTAALLAQDEEKNYGGSTEYLGLAAGATYVGTTTTVQNDGADALTSAPVLGQAAAWHASDPAGASGVPSGSVVGTFIPLTVTNNPKDFTAADAQAAAEKATLHGAQPIFGGQAVLPQSGVDGWVTAAGGSSSTSTGFVNSISPSSGAPGTTVTATVNGTPTSLSVSGCGLNGVSATPSSSNTATGTTSTWTFTIPSNASQGSCTLTFTATSSSGTVTSSQPFTVTASSNAGVTALPQLLSATVVSTTQPNQVPAGGSQGTVIQYVFSKPVTTTVASKFLVYPYNWDGSGPTASCSAAGVPTATTTNDKYSACSATVSSTNSSAVNALFTNIAYTSPSAAPAGTPGSEILSNYTLATVQQGAVTTLQGATNPEGSAAIGSAGTQTVTYAPNTTPAPDLVSVSNFRPAATVGETAVDFTFDQNAFLQATGPAGPAAPIAAPTAAPTTGSNGQTAGFYLVLPNDSQEQCAAPSTPNGTSGGSTTVPGGGNGTATTITVTCLNVGGTAGTAAGTALSTANVGRAFVGADTVSSAGPAGTAAGAGIACPATAGNAGTAAAPNYCNPLEAAHQSGTAGTLTSGTTATSNTTGPDLVSVALEPAGTSGNNTTLDAVLYTFDQPVNTATIAPTSFGIFHGASAQEEPATAPNNVAAPPTNSTATSVLVYYTRGDLVDATGAYVNEGGVQSVASANPASQFNQPDELGTTPSGASTTVTPGTVNAPQLTSVAIASTQQATGGTAFSVTYTFSHPVFFANPNGGGVGVASTPAYFKLWLANGDELTATSCSNGAGPAATNTTSNANTTVVCTGYNDGATGAAATQSAIGSALLGTVQQDAVIGTATGFVEPNPEGAQNTTGHT